MNENFQNKYEELKKEYDNMSKEMEKIISKYSSCNNELVKITHEYNELLLTNKVLSNNSKMITASSKEVKAGSKEVKAGSNIKTIINNNGIHELDRPQRLKRKFINKPYLFYNDSKFLYLRPIKFLFTSYNKNNLLGKLRTKLLTKILY